MKKLLLLIAILPMLSACGIDQVDTGDRGVKTCYGKVEGEPLSEGLYFYNFLACSITEFDVKTQKWSDKTSVYTKDAQRVDFEFTLNYNPDPKHVHNIYQKVGRDYAEVLIPQVVQGTIKNVIGRWNAMDLIANRARASEEIEATIGQTLANQHILISKFEATDLNFSDQFEHAVEQKQVAVQEAEKAKNKTVQVEEEAKQKVIAAEAEAKSMQIRSQALSQNQNLVAYEAVQKWDGKMPVYMLGESTPFVNLGGK